MQTGDQGRQLAFPARAWAQLFDLDDPEGKGAHRVNEAQRWLEENKFITVVSRPGNANAVSLLDDAGTGDPYIVPGVAANRERLAQGKSAVHRYVQIPSTFWTQGHLTILSGAGVAMFLALMCERGADTSGKELWFSPSDAERRFALSEDTRSKGLRELASAELVVTRRRPVNPTDFEVLRLRNVHKLNLERLDKKAAFLPPPAK
jgi:hypothetical protein